MALTMRRAGLSSGIDQDRADYTVFCGEWNIGRIYEVRGGPEHLRWFWSLHFPSSGHEIVAVYRDEGISKFFGIEAQEIAEQKFISQWPQWGLWA